MVRLHHTTGVPVSRTTHRVGIGVVAAGLLLAAGVPARATTPDDTTETTAAAETAATSGDTAATSTGDTTGDTTGGSDAATIPEGPGENHLTEDEGEPVRGGTLVYGVEADTANAWAPFAGSYATSGYVALGSVSDSLFAYTEAGELVPVLVETVEHNEDYTQWVLTIREGITFHDGTPLDAAAVKFNMETCIYSPLTAGAYAPTGTITAEGQTVTIDTAGGEPWVVLPAYFAGGSCGYMMSPTWLGSLPNVPHRVEGLPIYDAELAATPAEGNAAAPVGLGAFVFESYTPGNGNVFRAVRNENYWRGPNGITGEELPYLDAIEMVVAVDIDGRANGLRSGEYDIIHTSDGDAIQNFLDEGELEVISTTRYGDTGYVMLNVAEGADVDPNGSNAASPLLNINCRRALAHAIDQQRLADERGAGLVEPATGPFPPGSVGYLEDSGYPTYDVAAAQAAMDTCLSELGTNQISFSFNTTNDPFNLETNQLILSMWSEAFGDAVSVSVAPIEQGQYIGLALTGAFQAQAWRSHSGLDPDQQRLWWHSASAGPIGGLALNFGRFRDSVIDEALQVIKTNPDPEARREAAEAVNRRFGEQVYNWWLNTTVWGVIEQPYVNGVEAAVLPDGTPATGLVGAGRHGIAQLWCDEGSCE